MVKKQHQRFDYPLLLTSLLLIVLGILVLASASTILSYQKFHTPFYFLFHQIGYALLPGLLLGYLLFRADLQYLKKISPLLLLANIFLLGLVFVPMVGVFHGGATRWIDIGPVSFQPAEFLKLSFFLYLAAWLESKIPQKNASLGLKKFTPPPQKQSFIGSNLLVFLVILGLTGLFLVFQPNLSTFGTLFLVGTIMYFAAETPLWHSFLIACTALGSFWLLIHHVSYGASRLSIFLNPDFDPTGKGYQLKQSLIAIGSGGLWGLGLGMSRQKFGFLPESMSDTIFSIWSEEVGFIGGVLLVALFLFFLYRGIMIAKNANSKFTRLLALGITSWIFFQAVVNIGSVIRLIPPTGVPLPFISYGGSHLMAELMGLGVLLNISKKK